MIENVDTGVAEAAPPPATVDFATEAPEIAAPEGEAIGSQTAEIDLDQELTAILRRGNPLRDESGRFRSDQPAQAEGAQETEVSQDSTPTPEQEQAVAPAIQPPQSLSAEEKAEWATLPPKAQEIIARRDREATQALSRQGQEIGALQPIKRVLEQHKDVFERNGVTADDGISRLIAAERMLEADPVTAIRTLADAYGVDLGQFGQRQQPPGNMPPDVAQLHQKIAHLERQLNDTSTRIATREKAEAETQFQSMQSLVDKFKSDKAEWDDLEPDVVAELTTLNHLIQNGHAEPMTPEQKLAKAYDRALRANETVWNKRQEAERKAAEDKKILEAQKRLADADKAKKVNISSSPAKGASVQDIDSMLRGILRRGNQQG